MEIQGVLKYDPVVHAKGKVRAAVLRRHAMVIHATCIPYLPYLQGRNIKQSRRFLKMLSEDNYLWTRRDNNAVDIKLLEQLFFHAQSLQNWDLKCPNSEWIAYDLEQKLSVVKKDLIITRQKPGWAILEVDVQHIIPYLRELKREGITIIPSTWGPHITIIRGETIDYQKNMHRWTEHQGQKFTAQVDTVVKSNGRGYYWLQAQCPELEKVRTNLGLPPRPRPNFHLTLGKAT